MFDRYTLGPRSIDVTTRHYEHRAPTDESVKLLKEMESAARSKIIESMRIKSNDIEATVHRHQSYEDLRTIFVIHYAINGKKREVTVGMDNQQLIEQSLEIIWKALADDIATFMMTKLIQQPSLGIK